MEYVIKLNLTDAEIITLVTALDTAAWRAEGNAFEQTTLKRLAETIASGVPAQVWQRASEKLAEATR